MQVSDVRSELRRSGRAVHEVRWRWAAAAAGVIGALLRVRRFLTGQSFWLDEALLAQNVVDRGPAGLLEPLAGNQGAPVGFLWVVDGLHAAFGVDELWMRLPALIAGVALLPLTWGLARRLGSARTAALSVALVAVSPGLIRYSAELKQYSSDAAICVALLLAASRVGRHDRRGLAAMAGAGAAAVWFSHSAVLVLAGIGLAWSVAPLIDRDTGALVRSVPVGLAWAASLGGLYLLNLRHLVSNQFLTDYWQAGFPDSPLPGDLGAWAWGNTTDLLSELGGHRAASLVVAAVAVGAIVLARRRPRGLALALSPIPFLAVAAALDLYPYRGRLALFLLPVLTILLAGLADAPGRWRPVGIAVVCLALVAPTLRAVDELVDPLLFPAASPAVDFLLDNLGPDHAVYAHGPGRHPFELYTSGRDVELTGTTSWEPGAACADGHPVDRLTGRAWFFFAYTHSQQPADERQIVLSQLDATGRRLLIREGHDAFAALYDLDAAPTASRARPIPDAASCLAVAPS